MADAVKLECPPLSHKGLSLIYAFTRIQVFTNPGVAGLTPFVYPSRIGSLAQTSEILCESEMKLQSPWIFSGRSASTLDY